MRMQAAAEATAINPAVSTAPAIRSLHSPPSTVGSDAGARDEDIEQPEESEQAAAIKRPSLRGKVSKIFKRS